MYTELYKILIAVKSYSYIKQIIYLRKSSINKAYYFNAAPVYIKFLIKYAGKEIYIKPYKYFN